MLPAFAGALALSFAAIPLAQPIGILDGFLAAIVTVSDALLAVLAGKVSQQHWNGSQRSPRISSAHGPWSYYLDTLISYILVAKKTIWTITKASFLAAAALFPLLPLSGEVQGINRNCYVLNDGPFWARIMAGIALQTTGLLFYFLVATRASPLTIAFLQTPLCSVVLAILYRHELSPQGWINLSLCWVFCLVRAFQSSDDSSTSSARSSRSCCALLRKIFLSVVLYGAIYQGSYTVEEYLAAGTITLPAFGTLGYKDRIIVNVNTTVLPGYSGDVRDDYLGPRPSPNTFARMDRIMSNCADSITGSGVEDIVHCLAYLNSSADDYFSTPHSEGQHQNSSKSGMRPAFKPRDTPVTSKGTCTGEETLYHTYWTGPASWRFELFIKAYLYTQNLSCSRLWIWLDTDRDANAINNMLYHDAQFQRFHNLLDDNYIVLKQWTIPERIPLPRFSKAISTSHMYKPSNLDAGGDIAVADGVIQDASGMLFLVPDQLYKTVSNPTQVSDLVRFVVLHLHGGVYLDLDVLPLRDLRPLLLPNPASGSDSQTAWAEQWVERSENPGDYNTAILSLPANSSLSSYLLRGGMRMGMNFHPKIIGRMLWKEGRNEELAMLHNAFFDPLVTNLRRQGTRVCTVPCHKNFESSFMGVVDEPENEWSNYYGEPVSNVDGAQASAVAGHGVDVVGTNRTMEHFFRGAFAYHIHNQVRQSSGPFVIVLLTLPYAVVEVPRAEFLDGCHHSGPRRFLCGEENKCLWGDVGWVPVGRIRSYKLGMGAVKELRSI